MVHDTVRIKDKMRRDFPKVAPDASIKEAERFLSSGTGPVPVVEKGRLVGVITGNSLSKAADMVGRVSDVMSLNVVFCYEDQSPEEAIREMKQFGTDRLLVISRDRQLVGMLSPDDLSAAPVRESEAT